MPGNLSMNQKEQNMIFRLGDFKQPDRDVSATCLCMLLVEMLSSIPLERKENEKSHFEASWIVAA
ncbi:hypothetical protein KSX_70520 [Ktedonospora formicarum]|uniref:Uncharacterized protein n=1 Tax=Ktedonospora formicarum TaxID=2778364 RepID=A0A8J3IB87_9CHLR|nr:hypothetical protein KSX_70520 [Ktedonospora formicarum]